MSNKLEDVLKQLVETAEASWSPLIVNGLHAALARITELEKQFEDYVKAKTPVHNLSSEVTPKPISPIPPKPAPAPASAVKA